MEKTEELRQNWHITEMQHTWKARRALPKDEQAAYDMHRE